MGEAIASERRPLSWVVGPRGVVRAEKPSLRDALRPARAKQTDLAPPDSV